MQVKKLIQCCISLVATVAVVVSQLAFTAAAIDPDAVPDSIETVPIATQGATSNDTQLATTGTTDNDPNTEELQDLPPQPKALQQAPENFLLAAGAGSAVAEFVADNHFLNLRADKRLVVCGDNTYGQLGLGSSAATKVVTPTENTFFKDAGLTIKDIEVTEDASAALCTNGELYTWGKGLNGRLGSGNTSNISTPTLVAGSAILRFDKLYHGKEFFLATTDNNQIYAWGRNNKGQIGNGNKVDVLVPTLIMSTADIKHIAVGDDYVLMIKQDNTLWCWGANDKGQFPFPNEYKRSVINTSMTYDSGVQAAYKAVFPAIINVPTSNITFYKNTSVIENLTPKKIENIFSFITTTYTAQNAPTSYPLSSTYVNMQRVTANTGVLNGSKESNGTVSYNISTRITNGAAALLFDYPGYNIHATANINWTETPTAYIDFSELTANAKITKLQAGNKHGVITYNGKVYTFGDNSLKQQSADGVTNGSLSKAATINNLITTLDAGEGFAELVVAGDTNYAVTGTGNVYAWGGNSSGKAGTGSTASYIDTPTLINALNGKSIATIVAGRNTIYALSHTGDVYATGDNFYGQTGLGEAYAGSSKVTAPAKIETFKFAKDAQPPAAPDSVDTPEEVEAGTQIEITWPSVASATDYELVRHATPKPSEKLMTFAAATPTSEVVYSGDQAIFTDTAAETWQDVSYSLRARNFIGDYSPETSSGSILVKAAPIVDPGNGSSGGLSRADLEAILAIIAAGQGGGLTDEQLAAILASNGSGLTDEQLAAILANSGLKPEELAALLAANSGLKPEELAALLAANGGLKTEELALLTATRNKSSDVTVNVPDNTKNLAEILRFIVGNKVGQQVGEPVPSANIYNQGASSSELATLVNGLLANQPQAQAQPLSETDKMLQDMVRVMFLKMYNDTTTPTVATISAQTEYVQQPINFTVPKYTNTVIIIAMIASMIGFIIIRRIPEAEDEG